MIQKILKVGDRIEMKRLAAAGRTDGQEARLYNSQLLDFADDRNINISGLFFCLHYIVWPLSFKAFTT